MTRKGPLRVEGQKIISPSGKAVRLTGVNDPTLIPTDDYHGPSHAPENIKGWGFNSVRLLTTWQNWEPEPPTVLPEGGLEHHWNMDYEATVIAYAAEFTDRQVWVDLSPMMQHNFGTSEPWKDSLPDVPAQGFPGWLWPDAPLITEQEARCRFFSGLAPPAEVPGSYWGNLADYLAHVAELFASNPMVVGIEPFNEPYTIGYCATGNLDGLYAATGAAIRAANEDILIIFSDNMLPGSRKAMQTIPVSGAVYSFHHYRPTFAEWQGDVVKYLDRAAALGVPAWLGEFGGYAAMDTGNTADLEALLALLKARGAGWSYYAESGNPGGLTKAGELIQPNGPLVLKALQAGR